MQCDAINSHLLASHGFSDAHYFDTDVIHHIGIVFESNANGDAWAGILMQYMIIIDCRGVNAGRVVGCRG
jgi:hypothetical protein